jgi:hypothetical protein
MEYLIIEDGIIKEHCCGSTLPDGAVQVTDFFGTVGEPVAYYNGDWARKSDIELYKEKVLAIPSGYKLNDSQTALVEMTQAEKITAGLETLPAGYKITDGELVEKTDTEKITDGEITQDEYNNLLRAQYKVRVVELIRQQYSVNDEYDVLNKGIADATDAEYTAYRAYVAECKAIAKTKIKSI